MKNLISFLKDAVTEFRHVTWPTREQLQKHTTLVLGFVVAFAIVIAGLDALFSYGFSMATQNVRPAQLEETTRQSPTDEAARNSLSPEVNPVSNTNAANTNTTVNPGVIEAVDENGNPVEGVTITPVTN